MADPDTPTRDDLAKLLAEKDRTRLAYSAAHAAAYEARDRTDLSSEERVALDITCRQALKASCAADAAYDTALDSFMAAQQVAA
jgi:hypothetical protein